MVCASAGSSSHRSGAPSTLIWREVMKEGVEQRVEEQLL
jgi:hypothetical protein